MVSSHQQYTTVPKPMFSNTPYFAMSQQPTHLTTTFTHQPPSIFSNVPPSTSIVIPSATSNTYKACQTTPEEDYYDEEIEDDDDDDNDDDDDDEGLDEDEQDERRKRRNGAPNGLPQPLRRTGPVRRSKKGGWTEDEDLLLQEAVNMHGGKNWKKIAEMLQNRTSVQCLHRWQKVLNPNLVKGPWSKDEDDTIVKLVQTYGAENWSMIASHLPGRIGKQCRERWYNHLNPNIKKDPWSEEEERLLLETQEQMGNKWAEISKMLPGRTDNACKNHFNSLMARKKKGSSKPQRKQRRTRREELARGHARSLSDSVFYQFTEQQQQQQQQQQPSEQPHMTSSVSMLQINSMSFGQFSPSTSMLGFNSLDNISGTRPPMQPYFMYGAPPPPLIIPSNVATMPRVNHSPMPQSPGIVQPPLIAPHQPTHVRSAPTPTTTNVQQHFIPMSHEYPSQQHYSFNIQPSMNVAGESKKEQIIENNDDKDLPEIVVGSPFTIDLLAGDGPFENSYFKLELNIQDIQDSLNFTDIIMIKQEPEEDDLDLIGSSEHEVRPTIVGSSLSNSTNSSASNVFDNHIENIQDDPNFFFDEVLIKSEQQQDQVSGGIRKKKFKHAHHNRSVSLDFSLLNGSETRKQAPPPPHNLLF